MREIYYAQSHNLYRINFIMSYGTMHKVLERKDKIFIKRSHLMKLIVCHLLDKKALIIILMVGFMVIFPIFPFSST